MKRDFELIRLILKRIEEEPAGERIWNISIPNYDQSTVLSHIDLLIDAGLVKGGVEWTQGGIHSAVVIGLTWNGHDFLGVTTDETIWSKAKDKIIKPGISITFSLLLEWLKAEAQAKLGLSEFVGNN